MLGRSKPVTFLSNIPTIPLTYIMLTVYAGYCFYKGLYLYTILSIAAICIIRIFTGKIKLKIGKSIYVFGLPGSGKTMFCVKVAIDNKEKRICVNDELDHIKIKHTLINKDLLSKYRFGSKDKPALILWDEASLNGFDNRDYKTNFKGETGQGILEHFKKIRHKYECLVIANQGWDEVDKKLRDDLIYCAYWLINKGRYSVAVRLDKTIKLNELTGQPQDSYLKPNLLKRIIDPSCYVYISHKKYGKYYNTINDDSPYYYDENIED